MQVIKGKHAGFCFGVKRAIDAALALGEGNNYVLGEIIHNDSVIKQLENANVKTIYTLDKTPFKKGDRLIIRTHGEPEATFTKAKELGLTIIDCTCPFVKDIQQKVREHYQKGYEIAIIGDAQHPEIKGINGWCDNRAHIVNSSEELGQIQADKLCIVVQTTYSNEKFEKTVKNFAHNNIKRLDIFKTICYTTIERQREAELISKCCNAILVVGGEKSNNTQKLFNICHLNCQNVFRVYNPESFDFEQIKNFNKVGIVLGASTPIEQFHRCISGMEKITQEEIITTEINNSEVSGQEEVKEVIEESVKSVEQKSEFERAVEGIGNAPKFRPGQVINVKIALAGDDGLKVSLKNAKKEVDIPASEMLGDYNKEDYKDKAGESIRVMVVGLNPLKLSEKAMAKVLKEEAEIEEIKNGKVFETTITAANEGGLIGKFGSYDVFVPVSQIRIGFVKDKEKYIGKTLRLKAEKVEIGRGRRQIVGSQRIILEAEKAERDAVREAKEAEFFAAIKEGDVVLGTPVRFTAFGAFIDVNGFDCLAHISDLSWTGCKDCADVLEIGKQYEFKILKINEEAKKVSVGYKQLQAKPWELVADKYNVGDVIKGNVVRLVSFGAFVEVEKGVDGLVHVSQISNEWLENAVTALQVGQEIEAKILDLDVEKEKMNLSIKALLPELPKPEKVETEKASKGKKREKKEDEEVELREWKDESSSGVSIADLIAGIDK